LFPIKRQCILNLFQPQSGLHGGRQVGCNVVLHIRNRAVALPAAHRAQF